MRRILVASATALLMLVGGLLVAGCGEPHAPYAGHYRSIEPYAGKGLVDLELKENGEGTWKLEKAGSSIRFKWRVENDRIWVYTKEGGIIHITPIDGGQKLTVDMTGQWHDSCPAEQCLTFERVKGGGS